MKNYTIAIFLAAYLLFLAAQAGFSGGAYPTAASPAGNAPAVSPAYELEPSSETRIFRTADKSGMEFASYDYQILNLSVSNAGDLSPADAEAAAQRVETFNARMADLLEEWTVHGELLSQSAEGALQRGDAAVPYYDEAEMTGAVIGDFVSVRADRVSFSGGAHPISYTTGLLFDLTTGQFVPDPSQLADDPAAFREGAAEKLIEKAESIRKNRNAYWQDYAGIISRWNEGTVIFDEDGMLAVYSTYELGPYTMGAVELRLDWEELADLLGPGGLARLGAEAAATVS